MAVCKVINKNEEMNVTFTKLADPGPEVVAALHKWANDPLLVPFSRPSRNKHELEARVLVTRESLGDVALN